MTYSKSTSRAKRSAQTYGIRELKGRLRTLVDEERRLLKRQERVRKEHDRLESELQNRCKHKRIVHVQGAQVEHFDEPGCLDIRPPFRRCLSCGLSEEGSLSDGDCIRIAQADILAWGCDKKKLIDELASFSALNHPYIWKSRWDENDRIRYASREDLGRMFLSRRR